MAIARTTMRSRAASARVASSSVDRSKVQQRVLAWFNEHGRSFPWREHRDPYQTMVAEVMLQQTQTGRVAPAYGTFLAKFPDVNRLAHAPAMEVIQAWKGLGYNRRAVDLQRSAQAIEHGYDGVVPSDPKALRALPGIGEYSASAVACFAYDRQVPVVDVNVRRVLSRAVRGSDEVSLEETRKIAAEWLAPGEAYRWNQALMDVGAMICRIDAPLCTQCPLKASCSYRAQGKNKVKREPRAPKQSRFEGSSRQKRGGIIDHLRETAGEGVSLAALARVIHPNGDRDLGWLVDLLEGLERDGLVEMTPGARRASPRGIVRLPG
ncbi:MAG TPA: A/G-specific adenine glycosylase [Actinomycetota bacterium]|nr:A/G-specific adenine glycosylase [Actinomycetota bacterium]